MKGKITYINLNKGFIKINDEYFSYVDKLDFTPQVGMEVEFDESINPKGKNAINIVLIKSNTTTSDNSRVKRITNDFEDYLKFLKGGYFFEKDKKLYLKKEFLIEYPIKLVKIFKEDEKVNKISTVEKYFLYCRNLEGQYKINKDFELLKSKLFELIPLVYRSFNKEKPTVSQEFVKFIEHNIELSSKNIINFFNGFLPHFQSIIGYYK